MDIVLQARGNERLIFAGEHFRFDGIEVLPKPMQAPHPPVWMAATSEAAIDWAASRGFDILMDPHSSLTDLGSKRRRYGEQLAAAGFADQGRDIPMARLLALAETREQAAAVARRGAEWLLNSYVGTQHKPIVQTDRGFGGEDPVEHYVNQVIIHGTPDAVVDQLLGLKDTIGLNYLLCAPLSQRSFTLLTDQVLPRLA